MQRHGSLRFNARRQTTCIVRYGGLAHKVKALTIQEAIVYRTIWTRMYPLWAIIMQAFLHHFLFLSKLLHLVTASRKAFNSEDFMVSSSGCDIMHRHGFPFHRIPVHSVATGLRTPHANPRTMLLCYNTRPRSIHVAISHGDWPLPRPQRMGNGI